MDKTAFEEIKLNLKDKWLDYYEVNERMIKKMMDHVCKYNSRSIERPESRFIIGSVSALEPRLEEYLFFFLLVCSDLDTIVAALGLNFDPDFVIAQEELEKVGVKEVEIINLLAETQA